MNIARQQLTIVLLHKTQVFANRQVALTSLYVINSAKVSKSRKQICGVEGGRFYQQVDFTRSKQSRV